MNLALVIFIALVSFAIAFFLGRLQKMSELKDSGEKAQAILDEAEKKKKELLLEAKEEALRVRTEGDDDIKRRRGELEKLEFRLEKKEENIDRKTETIEKKEQEIVTLRQEGEENLVKTQKTLEQVKEKLQHVSGLTTEEAKKILLEQIETEVKDEAVRIIREVEMSTKEEADDKAQKILVEVMERMASEVASEYTTYSFPLPNDEMKGRIIGREGRNIRTLEQLTGVTFTVDDTPETIIISSFDPIRREVARVSLEKLIKDGRIHPARIEEVVDKSKKEIAKVIKESGEKAVYDVGIVGIPTELVKLIGRLRFRTSYGQNILQHSVEVAHIAAMLASELKANVAVAKKAAFLHDIGKAVDHEVEGGHALIGKEILERFEFPEEICRAVGAHHYDIPPLEVEDHIVMMADAISGARPGARRATKEDFLHRVAEIEQVANSFDGVKQSYALQAGREIRVIVNPDAIDDLANIKLARGIRDKIQETLKYPGVIKVVCIRETRAKEIAK